MHRPNWQTPAAMLRAARASAFANPDLGDFGSLTARLRARHGSSFRVQVLSLRFARPAPDEAELLGIKASAHALIRDVALWGSGAIEVRARSVLPLCTLSGRLRRLKGLKDRPLGAAIFAHPGLRRVRVEIAKLPAANPLVAPLQRPAWARRSLFVIAHKRLLVTEVFVGA